MANALNAWSKNHSHRHQFVAAICPAQPLRSVRQNFYDLCQAIYTARIESEQALLKLSDFY